ncbi:MAG: translocase FtsK, partial [Bryobacterales bacterium]|nr:translocase FtsK [Bryobacterales bacterium]
MRLFTPSTSKRLNEVTGFLLLAFGLLILLGLASYHAGDPSWDTAAGPVHPQNLTGAIGAYAADLLLQAFGLAAFLFPALAFVMGWKWMRSEEIEAPLIKLAGCVTLFLSACAAAALAPEFRIFEKVIPLGGATGLVVADILLSALNPVGAVIVTVTALIVSIYLVSAFTLSALSGWFTVPLGMWNRWLERQRERATDRRLRKMEAAKERMVAEQAKTAKTATMEKIPPAKKSKKSPAAVEPDEPLLDELPVPGEDVDTPPWEEIPICQLEEPEPAPMPAFAAAPKTEPVHTHAIYQLPSTSLLNEAPARSAFDEQELKNTA